MTCGGLIQTAEGNWEGTGEPLTNRCGYFWSRSRKELWHKGATSGNVQRVVEVRVDCDADALLIRVHPAGPACHTGNQTCFYQETLKVF